jgi:hypothetical protein
VTGVDVAAGGVAVEVAAPGVTEVAVAAGIGVAVAAGTVVAVAGTAALVDVGKEVGVNVGAGAPIGPSKAKSSRHTTALPSVLKVAAKRSVSI